MKTRLQLLTLALAWFCYGPAWSNDGLSLTEVSKNVYAIVGDLGNRSPANLGNNASFGFIVTADGVLLIDSGGTYRGAQHIHAMIKSVTDQPVVKVINTGGQDHRWMGNEYFKKLGAEIIANEKAVIDQKARAQDQLFALGNLVGEEPVKETNPVYADKTFSDSYSFVFGGTRFEIHHAGQAHTPGDSFVWLPDLSVMFSGDIVYVERMLGIIEYSSSRSWIAVFETMASYRPEILVPGHGNPTSLARARSDTHDYLLFIRQAVQNFIDDGGDISEIGSIDQSGFSRLLNFEMLAGRNAQQVFSELEWE